MTGAERKRVSRAKQMAAKVAMVETPEHLLAKTQEALVLAKAQLAEKQQENALLNHRLGNATEEMLRYKRENRTLLAEVEWLESEVAARGADGWRGRGCNCRTMRYYCDQRGALLVQRKRTLRIDGRLGNPAGHLLFEGP